MNTPTPIRPPAATCTVGCGTLRIIWPILDPTIARDDLIAEAVETLPRLVAQARARITRPDQALFRILPSTRVPGSGRVTDTVLVYDVPAVAAPPRCYHPGGRVEIPDTPDAPRDPTDVDAVVVDRVLSGRRPECVVTPAERRMVLDLWARTGRPWADLERTTGWNVARMLREHRGRHLEAVPA